MSTEPTWPQKERLWKLDAVIAMHDKSNDPKLKQTKIRKQTFCCDERNETRDSPKVWNILDPKRHQLHRCGEHLLQEVTLCQRQKQTAIEAMNIFFLEFVDLEHLEVTRMTCGRLFTTHALPTIQKQHLFLNSSASSERETRNPVRCLFVQK